MPTRFDVVAGFRGRIAFVESYPAKIPADERARALRQQYPDPRAEFWVSASRIRCSQRWEIIREELALSGSGSETLAIFGETHRTSFEASELIRNSVVRAIKETRAGRRVGQSISFLPYSADRLIAHLEALFQPGMTWGNYGEWHIDHVKPRVLFDNRIAEQALRCWALTNLQPLWAVDNMVKGSSYIEPPSPVP